MQNKWEQLEQELLKEIESTGGSKIQDGEFTTYRIISYEGSVGSTEWWTEEDYERHEKHVAELKAKGTYGKPWICTVTLKYFPQFDGPFEHKISDKSLESYRMTFVNFNKDNNDNTIQI